MNFTRPVKMVALVGGSGSGKSWLADRIQRLLGEKAACLSLDDFYLSRSQVLAEERVRINYDHPDAIDWPRVEQVLKDCRTARPSHVPRYDFVTHTRYLRSELWEPKALVLVEGLWLLTREHLRGLFDLKLFLDCPSELRLRRRIARDLAERGRTTDSVRQQFFETVEPMHEQFVVPQRRQADLVLAQPFVAAEVYRLADLLWDLVRATFLMPLWMRETFRAELFDHLLPVSPASDCPPSGPEGPDNDPAPRPPVSAKQAEPPNPNSIPGSNLPWKPRLNLLFT